MPNGRNTERIFGTGRNADSYCLISGGMPKTGETRNESVSVAKQSSASDRVGERLLLGSFGGIIFRVHNKTYSPNHQGRRTT